MYASITELLNAMINDKYSSEQTKSFMANMTTTVATPVNALSTQSPTRNGDYDEFSPATTQLSTTGVDPNELGMCNEAVTFVFLILTL